MSAPHIQTAFIYSGTLIENAQARHRQIEGGPLVPVLCLVVQLDTALGTVMRAQQLFPVNHERECEAAAARWKKGMPITIEAPAVGVELAINCVTHVHAPAPETAAEGDLFAPA